MPFVRKKKYNTILGFVKGCTFNTTTTELNSVFDNLIWKPNRHFMSFFLRTTGHEVVFMTSRYDLSKDNQVAAKA